MKNKEIKNWRLMQHIDFKDRKEGFLKVYSNNTFLHELIKFKIFYKLKRLGFKMYSECRFSNNSGRADLVAIKEGKGWIIEVLNSEKEERYNEKLNKYPIEFEMVQVNCKDFKLEDFEI